MTGVCFLVAGATAARLAAAEFTLAWNHSVERVRWEERYRVAGAQLELVEASVEGMGAGMEPGPDARLIAGRWRWRPAIAAQDELRLAASAYTTDYEICAAGRCTALRTLVQPANAEVVVVRPCDAPGAGER
ncbi:MAG: DUF1850 domain-containing protein [Casimicrobiaceae bacterium]